MNDARIWIVIPTFNRQKVLFECIDSLQKQVYKNLKIVVVDDLSTDGTLARLKENLQDIIVLSGDGYRWWSGSMNIGMAYVLANASDDDFIVSFNDDVLVDPEYLTNLSTAAGKFNNHCLVGSVAVDSKNTHKVAYCGTTINWQRGLWKGISPESVAAQEHFIKTDSLPGRGVLIPVRVVKVIGFYDSRLFPQYFGDEDFALRAKQAGYNLIVAKDAVVRSHVEMTGIGRNKKSFSMFLKSLRSIRSPNQISRRIRFVFKHAPRCYAFSFAFIDTFKVVTSYWRK